MCHYIIDYSDETTFSFSNNSYQTTSVILYNIHMGLTGTSKKFERGENVYFFL